MIFVKTSEMKAEIIFAIFKIIFLSGGVAAATFSGKQRSLLETKFSEIRSNLSKAEQTQE